jgi:hypothetical protein
MNFLKMITAAFLFAVMALQGAHAAEPSTPTPVEAGSFFDKMDGAVREVGRKAGRDLGKTLANSGYTVAATVKTTALGLAGALAVIYLLYEVMQFLSGRTKSMLQVLFDVGIPCIFAALFISQYAMLLPKFEGVLDVFRHLGTGVAGGGEDPFTGILNVYTAAIGKVTSAVAHAFQDVGKAMSFSAAITNSPKFMLALVDLLVTVLFALAILVLLLIGVAEVLGLLLIGPFLFAVGVAFGPIMIAGLATPWTRDYFTKWLQFIVISAGLTGVINVIFTIAAALMNSVKLAENTDEPTAVGLVIMAILILTINSMVSQAPSIASALFPGHVGVSKSGGGAVASAAKKAVGGMKNAGKAGRATMNGVVGAGQKSVKFAKSRMGGAKSAPTATP